MIAKELYGHITQRIIGDTNSKDGELYITKAYFYNANDDEAITDDIDDLDEDKTTKFTKDDDQLSTTIESDTSIAVVVKDSLDNDVGYNRIYYTNNNDKILFVVDIEKVTASEILEEIIIQLDDIETIVN